MPRTGVAKLNPRVIAGAPALLIGWLLLLCAVAGIVSGAWRTYDEHVVESRWTGTVATIDKRWLFIHHPTWRDNGLFWDNFSLHCRLRYEFSSRQHVFNLVTLSSTSSETRAAIEKWVAEHRPGTTLNVRVNPSHPDEIAVVSELPIGQFGTSRQAWRGALFCGVVGALLATIAHLLLRSVRAGLRN